MQATMPRGWVLSSAVHELPREPQVLCAAYARPESDAHREMGTGGHSECTEGK